MEVKIRPLEEKDAYTSVKWRNIPEIWKYTANSPKKKITIEDELNWIRKVSADPKSKRFAILAEGVYVGNIYLTDIDKYKGEYHVFIGERSYWGKGIAKQASKQIIDYARNELKLKKVELGVSEENVGAIKLYESLGFKSYGKDKDFIRMKIEFNQ